MTEITSASNPKFKYFKNLLTKKGRSESGEYMVEGFKCVSDAVNSERRVTAVIVCDKLTGRLPECNTEIFVMPSQLTDRLSDTKTPQGVLCVVKTLDKRFCFDTIRENGILLALDSIQDPSNLGTILRSADALGVSGVVLSSTCCDVFSPKVVRGSMGAVFRVPFYITNDLPQFVSDFNKYGKSYACVLDDTASTINNVKFCAPSLSVIGNEGNGVSKEVISACTDKLYIPMHNNAESLNAAVAASIIMWEMVK